MKLICGGGGVDANGNAYELPKHTVEVADDYMQRMADAIFAEGDQDARYGKFFIIAPKAGERIVRIDFDQKPKDRTMSKKGSRKGKGGRPR